jgi:hypothetical protein
MENNINSQQTIGTSAVVISEQKVNGKTRRAGIICINSSTASQVITIAIDKEPAAGAGIVLSPGGSWSDTKDGGGYPTQAQILAIANLAGALLSIQERVEN